MCKALSVFLFWAVLAKIRLVLEVLKFVVLNMATIFFIWNQLIFYRSNQYFKNTNGMTIKFLHLWMFHYAMFLGLSFFLFFFFSLFLSLLLSFILSLFLLFLLSSFFIVFCSSCLHFFFLSFVFLSFLFFSHTKPLINV